MAENFLQSRKFRGPTWLTGHDNDDGEKLGVALEDLRDASMDRALLGLLVRFPQQDPNGTPGPDDALAALGRDRDIVRGINEISAGYAVRIKDALDTLRYKGNPWALLDQLRAYIANDSSGRTFDAHSNTFGATSTGVRSFDLDTGLWDWDGIAYTGAWSKFWTIIYPGTLWETDDPWGSGTWGDGGTWGTTALPGEVASTRHIVASWKPRGTRCVSIVIALDPASFDPSAPEPDGTWAHWGKNVDGVYVAARLGTARYWDGTSNFQG
jgi:hypothetical protein